MQIGLAMKKPLSRPVNGSSQLPVNTPVLAGRRS
jgi:hypothetical protein